MLATTPIDQLKSVKDSSYLRPRIPIRLNFTYITSALPLYSQVTTYTEPFTVFRHSLGPYRTRTCDLRLYADALPTELTAPTITLPRFSSWRQWESNPSHFPCKGKSPSLGTCVPNFHSPICQRTFFLINPTKLQNFFQSDKY